MVRRSPVKMVQLAAGLSVLAVAAACGGSDGDSGGSTGSSKSGGTVSTKQFDNVGNVLVDSSGKALYFAEQETDGSIKCVKSCLKIWEPLTMADGQSAPSLPNGVKGKLGTVKRPDGAMQVTMDGKPLYRFSFDPPGKSTGNNTPDDFEGVSFVWHVATASGVAASDSGGGGYNY